MSVMDWQQKAAALDALEQIELRIAAPGKWFLYQKVRVCDDGIIISKNGSGTTPQGAVEDRWEQLSSVQFPSFLIARHGQDDERRVFWNGFMWADIPTAIAKATERTP